MNLLTSTRLRDARACLRLDHYKYGLGYRAVAEDAESLTLGRLVHLGLEAWWKAHGGGADRLVAAIAAIRAEPAEPFARARAEAMLVGYEARWGASASAYETLAVEVEFRAPLINPATSAPSRSFLLAGKVDAIVRERATGRVLLVEHKTASEDITPGSIYWRRLRMDGQVSLYFAGARVLGFDPAGCLYDVLGKPKQRPLEANTRRVTPETPDGFLLRLVDAIAAAPDAYYARGEVARADTDLVEADADHWAIASLLRDAARTGLRPRNPDACMRYGRICEFLSVCDGSGDLADPVAFTRMDNTHPELTPKEEAQCQSLP